MLLLGSEFLASYLGIGHFPELGHNNMGHNGFLAFLCDLFPTPIFSRDTDHSVTYQYKYVKSAQQKKHKIVPFGWVSQFSPINRSQELK